MKIVSSLVVISAVAAATSAHSRQGTPAPTTVKPVTTPAATTAKGYWSVSVERDATYSIAGPICSGSGKAPAGKNCPKKGDVAIERCLPYLKSYTASGKCVAPANAECKVIHTGAWGCVFTSGNATNSTGSTNSTSGGAGKGGKATPVPTTKAPTTKAPTTKAPTTKAPTTKAPTTKAPTTKAPTTKAPTPAPTKNGTAGGNKTTNGTAPGKADNGTIQAPTKLTNLAGVESSSSSAAVVGAVAAVAAVAAAAVGTVLYKKNQNKSAESMANEVVDVVTP